MNRLVPQDPQPVAYCSGQWVPQSSLALPLQDLGVFQGVTAVERLRTYHHVPWALDAHRDRFAHSCEVLQIGRLPADPSDLVQECLDRNAPWLARQEDVGITLLATPGSPRCDGPTRPTLIVHPTPLDLQRIGRLRSEGQRLCITSVRQPSPECWPRTIKVRCRLHYYLADLEARRTDPQALGVLLDEDGTVTETSVANVLVAQQGRLISPPAGRVLPGVSLGIVRTLAAAAGITWSERPLFPAEVCRADEVILTGTGPAVWAAVQVDEHRIGDGAPGPLCRQLQAAFDASK